MRHSVESERSAERLSSLSSPVTCMCRADESDRLSDAMDRSLRDFIRKVAEREAMLSFKIPGQAVLGGLKTPGEILERVTRELAWALTKPVDVAGRAWRFETLPAKEIAVSAGVEWYEENRVLIAEYLMSLGR